MECYSDQHAYIKLKDHKENFRNNTKRIWKIDLNDIFANAYRKNEVN